MSPSLPRLLALLSLAACAKVIDLPNFPVDTDADDTVLHDTDADTDSSVADTDIADTDVLDTDTGSCAGTLADDADADGFTEAQGDCDDCDPNRSPGAFDFVGDGVDDDCDGGADDVDPPCDAGLARDDADAAHAAAALGLCRPATVNTWGLVSAAWAQPDGSTPPGAQASEFALGHGLLASFGTSLSPVEGDRLAALSTGAARASTDPGFYSPFTSYDKGYASPLPAGLPADASTSCPGVTLGAAHDGVALRVVLRTPSNAHSLTVDIAYLTSSFPTYACTAYDDQAVVLVSPAPSGSGATGNVAFDTSGEPLTAASPLMAACDEATIGAATRTCPLGRGPLSGTGFDLSSPDGASTGWRTLTVPIEAPGSELVLTFAAWDSSDGVFDSTLVVDNLRFHAGGATLTGLVP